MLRYATRCAACRAAGAEVLVVMQPTISDGRLAPVIGQLWDRGIVLWATTERPAGPMISANSLVGTHVFAATLRQLGRAFELVYGHPDDRECRNELEIAVRVAGAAQAIRNAKTGLVGYHAPGFVDLHSDPALLSRLLGVQLHHLGITDFVELINGVDEATVSDDVAQFKTLKLPYAAGVTEDVLPMQSRIYLAVTALMSEERLSALAVRCWPELPNLLGQWPYLAFARLASEGSAVSMEGDVDGALGNLMAELLGRRSGLHERLARTRPTHRRNLAHGCNAAADVRSGRQPHGSGNICSVQQQETLRGRRYDPVGHGGNSLPFLAL